MSTNLSLSFELISLMGWLLRHHKGELNQLLEKAIEDGFMDELQTSEMKEFLHNAAASNEVVQEFFAFFEEVLQRRFDGKQLDTESRGALADEVKKIDGQVVDQHVLFSSIQKVKNDCAKETEEGIVEHAHHVKELLCKQILKQWDPSQHDQLN